MNTSRRLTLIAVIIGVSVVVDQITKLIAVMTLKNTPPRSYLGDFFRLQYAENTGAMLGFGSDLPEAVRFWVLTVMVGILLLGLLVYLLFNPHLRTSQVIAFSLISGGGISNFIDRLLNDGRVVDFMNMGIGWLRTGIFNVADVLIMIGLGMVLLLGGWRERRKPASEEQSPASVPSSSNPPEN